MFSKTLTKTLKPSVVRFLSTLKPTSTIAAAEPSVSSVVDDDGYSTAAAAEKPTDPKSVRAAPQVPGQSVQVHAALAGSHCPLCF